MNHLGFKNVLKMAPKNKLMNAFNGASVLALVLAPVVALVFVSQLLGLNFAQAAIPEGAAPETSASTSADATKAPAKLKTKKSTEVNFDDVLVQGKYHFSDEAVTTVEQDKILDALLGVRTDFKDRLSKSAARH